MGISARKKRRRPELQDRVKRGDARQPLWREVWQLSCGSGAGQRAVQQPPRRTSGGPRCCSQPRWPAALQQRQGQQRLHQVSNRRKAMWERGTSRRRRPPAAAATSGNCCRVSDGSGSCTPVIPAVTERAWSSHLPPGARGAEQEPSLRRAEPSACDPRLLQGACKAQSCAPSSGAAGERGLQVVGHSRGLLQGHCRPIQRGELRRSAGIEQRQPAAHVWVHRRRQRAVASQRAAAA